MSKEFEEQLASSSAHSPLTVEVRVREVETADAEGPASVPATVSGEASRLWVLVLCAVVVIGGLYVGTKVNHSWIAVDDGTLAQSALRVFEGQLPHSDFSEIYTGGLSFIHAAAFHVFGVNLRSLRICVFLFFLCWIPAVYYVATRFAPPLAAGMVTLLAIAWSFPNYPSAMPSWYNLFFATFGAASLLRYLEVRNKRWLFIAGMCGGASILIKVIGAYYVAGALLFLAFLEQGEAQRAGTKKRSWVYRAFSAGALTLFLGALMLLLRHRLAMGEFYHFVLPSAVVVGLILLGERSAGGATRTRFATLLRSVIPFVSGLLAPILVFLLPYARAGSVGRLFSGVTASTISHVVDLAVARPTPPQYMVAVLPLLAIVAAAMFWDRVQGRIVGAAIGTLALVVAIGATRSATILSGMWFSATMLTPMVVLCGAGAVLALQKRDASTKLEQQRLVLMIALAATCTLVQFPFSVPIYLCYALPLTILALLATVMSIRKRRGTYVLCSVLGLYLVFGVMSLIPLHLAELTHAITPTQELRVPRGGIEIEDEAFWEALTVFLQARAPNGVMYAGNSCPELYFLTGLKNPTQYDNGAPEKDVLKLLESDQLKLVVITDSAYFSGDRTSPKVIEAVVKKFPNHRQAGFFQIFWRE